MKTVLFLCTGNYYRSRFAEELFNHLAERNGLDWRARSRGLALERGVHNIGPISTFAEAALSARKIPIKGIDRMPEQCTNSDLEVADLIIALHEDEHRPLVIERFPLWDSRAEYWRVPDTDLLSPDIALPSIEKLVGSLVARLRGREGAPG
ncbi:MAG: low molecular weight phosphatase family protein [Pseudomonadota bacterium]